MKYMASLSNDRDNSQASLSPGIFGASKVMYLDSGRPERGLRKPGNPAAKRPRNGACIHINFLSRHCMLKVVLLGGCSGRVLGGLLQKNAVSGAILGSRAEDTCSSSYCCRCCTTQIAESLTQESIRTKEISRIPLQRNLRCLPWAMHMHTHRIFQSPAPTSPRTMGCRGYS